MCSDTPHTEWDNPRTVRDRAHFFVVSGPCRSTMTFSCTGACRWHGSRRSMPTATLSEVAGEADLSPIGTASTSRTAQPLGVCRRCRVFIIHKENLAQAASAATSRRTAASTRSRTMSTLLWHIKSLARYIWMTRPSSGGMKHKSQN